MTTPRGRGVYHKMDTEDDVTADVLNNQVNMRSRVRLPQHPDRALHNHGGDVTRMKYEWFGNHPHYHVWRCRPSTGKACPYTRTFMCVEKTGHNIGRVKPEVCPVCKQERKAS